MNAARAQPRDFAEARRRREKGIVDSILHAERNSRDWADRAFAKLCQYAAIKRRPWTVEEFRLWATAHGLDAPPELRAFGGITLRALHRDVIRVEGYAPTVASNGARRARYVSVTDTELPPDT
jgi:hypothetical protein